MQTQAHTDPTQRARTIRALRFALAQQEAAHAIKQTLDGSVAIAETKRAIVRALLGGVV